MKIPFSSEREIQKMMEKAIKKDELFDIIQDAAEIEKLSQDISDIQFPQFAVDRLARQHAVEAGSKVLNSLRCLKLLSGDKNISITANEVLRPDLVCINPEQQSVVLFELKKTNQTGRQALTELLAYEQEIKNLLPLLSNYDFNFVLISPEWSSLMDHAVSAAISWSNRKILCLTPSKIVKKLRLQTRIPSAWKVTGSVYFPPEAMPCITVCLYSKNAYETDPQTAAEDDDEPLDPRILTALEITAREGDRLGGHGFALLWKDHLSISLTNYNLTVCGVAPFAFFQASRNRGIIKSEDGWLVEEIDQYLLEHNPWGHSESLIATATAAYPLLREISDPHLEGFSNWETERHGLSRRAEPLLCEFWGVLGDHARAYVLNPAVRTHRRNTLRNGMGDWRDPFVGLPLIQSFTRPEIFFEGVVRCSDAFRLGVLFGLDRTLRMNLRQRDNPSLRCRFEWNRIELMTAIDEVRLLANAAENVSPPHEPLCFYADPHADDEEENARALDWIAIEFFRQSPTHSLFFNIGINGSLIFDQQKMGLRSNAIPPKLLTAIEKNLRAAFRLVLSQYKKIKSENGFWGELTSNFEELAKNLGLRKKFSLRSVDGIDILILLKSWDSCLKASEHVLEPVFHKNAPISITTIDWLWLKQGVAEMRARGEYDAGVLLLPNGQIVTGRVLPQGIRINLKIDSPDEQVPFMDRSHGFGLMKIVTWNDLESGQLFKGPKK